MTNVLILHPGAMGASLGACLRSNRHQALWASQGRSEATRSRAEADEFVEFATLDDALASAEVVVSICPPEFAEATARSVADRNFNGVFVDANATSPMTAGRIADIIGENFIDGSVIGPPARQPNATRLYLSGPKADVVCQLFASTYASPTNLGKTPTAASALKMCYAAYTKGTSALLINIRALAEANGITEPLLAEWEISQPELFARSERTGPAVSRKAWRFAAEMREIAHTFHTYGLPEDFHVGAANLYERLAAFKDQPPTPTTELIADLLRT